MIQGFSLAQHPEKGLNPSSKASQNQRNVTCQFIIFNDFLRAVNKVSISVSILISVPLFISHVNSQNDFKYILTT